MKSLCSMAVIAAPLLAPLLVTASPFTATAARAETLVFAAASTTNAVNDVIAAYRAETGASVRPSYASSSTLARQIDQGAPAQIYISANEKWMDYLSDAKLLVPDSRQDLLGNSLVLIAPATQVPTLKGAWVSPDDDLLSILGDSRLAMGDPDHVPAGIYGQQALDALGLWDAVAPLLARTSDVRGALALVERAEAPLGIVYATDAVLGANVRVVATFPADSHNAITYPVALIAGEDAPTAEARAFYDYLTSDQARAIFERYGFVTP